jgi:hypothetical protein
MMILFLSSLHLTLADVYKIKKQYFLTASKNISFQLIFTCCHADVYFAMFPTQKASDIGHVLRL